VGSRSPTARFRARCTACAFAAFKASIPAASPLHPNPVGEAKPYKTICHAALVSVQDAGGEECSLGHHFFNKGTKNSALPLVFGYSDIGQTN
jgi:hypothetical protein